MKNYPENREWRQKVYAMPKIPKGKNGQVESVYKILNAVKSGESPNRILAFEGSSSQVTLDRLCEWLRPTGLVNKEIAVWRLTENAEKCLESRDELYLTAVFCTTIIFMGEILYYLQTPLTSSDLLSIAQTRYKITWKTKSEIGNRLTWFREVGLVFFEDYKLEYSLTEKGRQFLEEISVIKPEELVFEKDSTEKEEELAISDWALKLCNENILSERKMSIGYIPGKTSEAIDIITGYLQLLKQETSIDEIRKYSASLYKIAVSSSNMFTTFLVTIGFINRISKTTYCISELGEKWLLDASYLNLVVCLNNKYLFVFELLAELEKESKSSKELAAIAKVSYLFDRESIDEIRRRIILLKQAKLVMEDGTEKYCLTQRGKNLLKAININPVIKREHENGQKQEDRTTSELSKGFETIIMNLRLSSRDSSNPNCFENAIKEAFEFLGFKAIWLGGSGKTDVLLQAQTSPKFSYSVAVDGKSTNSGNVTEGAIDFDTLKEHRRLHDAQYTVVAGCSFQGERLVKRAKEHKVLLMDVDNLEQLIRNHAEIPLTSEDYRRIFEQSGLVSIKVLEEARKRIRRYGMLVDAIMTCLVRESTDEVTEGILSVKELYRSLRDDKRFENNPTLSEIEDMLGLISSPLINCVGKTKEGYYAIGSLEEAGNKFRFYARACLERNQ